MYDVDTLKEPVRSAWFISQVPSLRKHAHLNCALTTGVLAFFPPLMAATTYTSGHSLTYSLTYSPTYCLACTTNNDDDKESQPSVSWEGVTGGLMFHGRE